MKTIAIIYTLIFSITFGYAQKNELATVKDKYHDKLVEENKGVAVLTYSKGKTKTTGIGRFDLNERSAFNIGSATKTFTVILILQEMEKGNLKLSDSIGKYLDPIKNVDPGLTIESLITHETGLDEVIGGNLLEMLYTKSDSLYNASILTEIEENDPDLIGKFDYCNTNYFLLGKIIEKVADRSYADLLRERIFLPIGMNETHPYVHKNIPNLATPYHEGKDVSEYMDYRFFANIAYAAGSISSTLHDMKIFYLELFEGNTLLKKATVKRMLTDGNDTYGLGLFKPEVEHPFYGHGGNNVGYSFRNGYNIENKTLYLIFSNNRSIPSKNMIVSDLIRVMNNEEVQPFQALDLSKFQHFIGKFELKEANLTFEITLEENKLYLNVPAQDVKSELIAKDDTTLVDAIVGASFTTVEGNKDQLTFAQNGFKTTIHRLED